MYILRNFQIINVVFFSVSLNRPGHALPKIYGFLFFQYSWQLPFKNARNSKNRRLINR